MAMPKKGGGLPPQLRAAAIGLAKDKTEAVGGSGSGKKGPVPFKPKKIPPFMVSK